MTPEMLAIMTTSLKQRFNLSATFRSFTLLNSLSIILFISYSFNLSRFYSAAAQADWAVTLL